VWARTPFAATYAPQIYDYYAVFLNGLIAEKHGPPSDRPSLPATAPTSGEPPISARSAAADPRPSPNRPKPRARPVDRATRGEHRAARRIRRDLSRVDAGPSEFDFRLPRQRLRAGGLPLPRRPAVAAKAAA